MGHNGFGQLGNGAHEYNDKTNPVTVLSSVRLIEAADFNNDAKVNTGDATKILPYIVGK